MKAIILAAGVGNRLKPVTDKMPKSLIKIGKKTILEQMIDSLVSFGVNDICFVVGHMRHMIIDFVGKKYKSAKLIEAWAVTSDIYDETSEALKTNDRKSN